MADFTRLDIRMGVALALLGFVLIVQRFVRAELDAGHAAFAFVVEGVAAIFHGDIARRADTGTKPAGGTSVIGLVTCVSVVNVADGIEVCFLHPLAVVLLEQAENNQLPPVNDQRLS